jgi:hypothetical protein
MSLDRYDRMQRLDKSDGLDPYYSRHDDDEDLYRGGNVFASMALILMGVVWGLVIMSVIHACDKEPVPTAPVVGAVRK